MKLPSPRKVLPATLSAIFFYSWITSTKADLPASFDLRTAGIGGTSLVSAVQNQGALGDCWTFSSATAIDSNLLLKGLLPTSTTPPPIQISSWHIASRNGAAEWLEYNENTHTYSADDGSHNWGGFHWMMLGYLTRGRGEWTVPDIVPGYTVETMGAGPVFISNDPNNNYPLEAIRYEQSLAPHVPQADQPIAFQVRSIQFLDQSTSGRSDAEQILAVKNALMNTGAVITIMRPVDFQNDDLSPNPDPDAWTTIVYKGSEDPSHSVAIIG